MVVRRGDIWWAELPGPTGSEPGYRRPVVIVQADQFNQTRIRTVVAISLTSNLRLADVPGNVLLGARETDLRVDSVANVTQLATLDRAYLTERAGRVPSQALSQIEDGLRLALDL